MRIIIGYWQFLLLVFCPLFVQGQPQQVQPVLQQPFGFNAPQGFNPFPGVPQMPLTVQPLQPFGIQPFQPQPVQVLPQQAAVSSGLPQIQGFPQMAGLPQGGATFPQAGGLPTFGVQPPAFNPYNPFNLPGFGLPPQQFAPFPGMINVSPLYSTNQAVAPAAPAQTAAQVAPAVRVEARPQFEVPQGVEIQQGAESSRVEPVIRPRTSLPPPPPTSPPTVRPTTVATTPAPTTTKATTTAAPETTALPVVDARSERKAEKKPTTSSPLEESSEEEEEEIDDNIPPEVPKELTEMRRRLEERIAEEERLEFGEQVEETASVEPTRKRDHLAHIRTGSATPKVIDFRAISQPKVTTPGPQVDVEELTNQKEIEDILNRVLDAVAPMHKVVATSSESEFKARLAR